MAFFAVDSAAAGQVRHEAQRRRCASFMRRLVDRFALTILIEDYSRCDGGTESALGFSAHSLGVLQHGGERLSVSPRRVSPRELRIHRRGKVPKAHRAVACLSGWLQRGLWEHGVIFPG